MTEGETTMEREDNGIDKVPTDLDAQHHPNELVDSSPVGGPSLNQPTSDGESDKDAPFVRKRAYTSIRQITRFDQLNTPSTLPSPRLCSPHPSVSDQCVSNPSCQLLLATPQPILSTNSNINNPQVTHLRRRRSSQLTPFNSAISRNSNQTKQITLTTVHYSPITNLAPIYYNSVKEGTAAFPSIATGEPSLMMRGDGNDVSFESTKPRDPAYSEGHIFPRRGKSQHTTIVRAALGDILSSSFNGNATESDEGLWTKAGDAYRAIAFADDQIAQRLATHKEHQQRSKCCMQHDLSDVMHDLYVNTNKENKLDDSWRHLTGAEGWPSSTIGSSRYSAFSSQKSCASSRLSTVYKDPTSNCPPSRILCPGLRFHRSETNVRRGLSGSFLSRQCLCKIISLDGSIGKSYSWKPYYMSITAKEVRFIKASSTLYGVGRPSKGSRLSTQVLAPPNTDISFTRNDLHPFSSSIDDAKNSHSPITTNHQALVNQLTERTRLLKDSLSSSHLTLPIIGLMWNSEELPTDLPHWLPLGHVPTTHGQSITPDHMDPALSGLSKSHDHMEEDDPPSYSQPIDPNFGPFDAIRTSFRCFRFTHLNAAVELLFVFPDESVALTCLNMCKLYGGQPIHRKDGTKELLSERTRDTAVDSTETLLKKAPTTLPHISEEKFPFSSRTTGGKTFFLQSIKQFLNRSTGGHNINVSTDSTPFSTFPSSVESKLAAILNDPPDFCDLHCPGPVFGCPLEDQLESPDYSFVPVLLHCFVTALEFHGISLPGLYRKPGRQRSISQFVCVSNLVPKNVDLILTLDAWCEPYAICGLLKYFLRRLPSRLLDLGSWEPLALLVPDKDSPSDITRQAYLLLSIRVKLWKMASEAYGAPSGCFIPLCSADPHASHCLDTAANSSIAGAPNPTNASHLGSSRVSAKWRWATLLYVVNHLRNVVSHAMKNEVTHQCAAICFGPVLFQDSIHVDKLNVVLENVLRHWQWLIQGLPTTEHTDPSSSPIPRIQTHEWTLQEAVDYLRNFELIETKPLSDLNGSHFNVAPSTSVINTETTAQPTERTSPFSANSQSLHQAIKSLLLRSLERTGVSADPQSLPSSAPSGVSSSIFSSPHLNVKPSMNTQSPNRYLTPTWTHSIAHSSKQPITSSLLNNSTSSQLSDPATALHQSNMPRLPNTSSENSLLSTFIDECLPRSSSSKL